VVEKKKPAKPWRLYRVGPDGKLIQLAEADTPEELWTIHKRRADYRYEVFYKWQRIVPQPMKKAQHPPQMLGLNQIPITRCSKREYQALQPFS
jgi:hypothetical protein